MARALLFLIVFALLLPLAGERSAVAQSDSKPPELSDVRINYASSTAVEVTWKTNEEADSLVNYGLDDGYGIVRDPVPNKKNHKLFLENLEPSTVYHLRIVSSDPAGNQIISGDYLVTTRGTKVKDIEKVKDEDQQVIVEKTFALLDKVKDPQALDLISDKVKEVAAGITDDLTIIGTPDIEVSTNSATITWTTNRSSDSQVFFVPEKDYIPEDPKPYTFSQGSPEEDVTEHRVELIGLEPFTVYHFQVVSEDEFGILGKSKDLTLTTKAVLPNILNLRLSKVEETSATFRWETSVPSSALVEYTNLTTKEKKSLGSPSLITDHTLRIADLVLGTQYEAVIIAENAGGDRVKSDPIRFITVKDVLPPIISTVTNESTLYPSSDAKIQTIVSWESDEPCQCDFYYREGIAPGLEDKTFPRQDDGYTKKHVQVIVDFRPSTVYKFWVTCKDPSGNSSRSEDFVLFTPQKEKSIIDIILENFEGTFGWLKQIKK